MLKLDRESIFSVPGMFILYILLSSLVIVVFRLILPGEAVPLGKFSMTWRFLRGVEDIIILCPSLVLSVLVLPFGVHANPHEKMTPFSPQFMKKLSPSVICAIVAAVIYTLLFLLVFPLVLNTKTDIKSQAALYRLSLERAQAHAADGEWAEASRFTNICEKIWPGSPELSDLETEIHERLEDAALNTAPPDSSSSSASARTTEALNVTQALSMAEQAMNEERYFDAHWLATLAGDLAAPGSVETTVAQRIASQAWNAVSSLQPTATESLAYRIYNLKRDAYRDLVSSEWISAYYLFLQLLALAPNDPEGLYYLGLSEQGLARMSFFVDEMELRESPAGALYSIPFENGRIVMRFSSLSVFPDSAYGIGFEVYNFDRDGRSLWRMESPYAKIIPVALESGRHITILMRALDRYDADLRWVPVKEGFAQAPPSIDQVTINIDWEDFLLLTDIRRGQDSLTPSELMTASALGSQYGYIPALFQSEIISRFAEPVLFLPLFIFGIVIGWRFRSLKASRYIWLPMLIILPVVFNGVVYLIRIGLENISIWAVINFSFSTAIFIFGAAAVVLLFLSLIVLAAQHD